MIQTKTYKNGLRLVFEKNDKSVVSTNIMFNVGSQNEEKHQAELREKYNTDNLFKNRNNNVENIAAPLFIIYAVIVLGAGVGRGLNVCD